MLAIAAHCPPWQRNDLQPEQAELRPHIGQHTGEVLDALGYSEAEVARLRERRVV